MVALLLLAMIAAPPPEADYYRVIDIDVPDGIVLEVGGLALAGQDAIFASTRRGDIWHIDGVYTGLPIYTHWTDGLQEPLGLLNRDGWLYTVQRGEFSRIRDEDGDGRADRYETICDDWSISGNYHEYAFGPRVDQAGNFWVTFNKPFGGEPFGRVDWRGWAVRITPEGEMQPVSAGLRSPSGIEVSPWGDVFYSDNQGEWCGAGKLSHLEVGDFHGHPWGIDSCHHPESLVEHPGAIESGRLMPVAAAEIPNFKLPAIWFPYDKMGKAPSGMAWDQSRGRFGPFGDQLFIGDQHHASVMRVYLEKVRGHWQGACFPFRSGLASGVVRVLFGTDSSLFVGMTNRGWSSKGTKPWGLQRLAWTGRTPPEILRMRAISGGFRLDFTLPMDPETLVLPASYRMSSYTYKLHSDYGSPEVDTHALEISSARVLDGGRSVILLIEGLREGYVHELHADGLRTSAGSPLLHSDAYYTLIRTP